MNPIFISGLYRSGTTVLTRILDQSNEVSTTYDTIHFLRFSYNKYNPISENYRKLIQDTRDRVVEKLNLDFNIDNVLNQLRDKNITQALVYDSIMKEFLQLTSNERWAEKTNVEWESIVDFLKMYPEGKAIHIYRDPRAVLASYKNFTNQPGLSYMDAIFASLAMFNFIQRDEIKNNENILLLCYEDFVKSPESYTKNICDFLGIKYKNEMLDVSSFKDIHGKKFERNSSFGGHKNRIDTSSMEIWKNKLSDIEIYLTEMVLKDKLKDFNYELSGTDLSQNDFKKLFEVLNDDFVNKRYKYWLKNANGLQGYPNTENLYHI